MQSCRTVVLALAVAAPASADAPLPPPSTITVCSAHGGHCAVSDPGANRLTVYAVTPSGRAERWRIEGWERVFHLADDGEHLGVCYGGMNLLPASYRPDWPMVRLYEHGRLVRSVALLELMPDLSKLRRTVSHYDWGRCVGFADGHVFEVQTVDGRRIRLDAASGRPVP